MYIVNRSLTFVRGALLSYGPQMIKRRVWDKEYSKDKWNFADNTVGDCVYGHLERYAANGSILDMGCGSGNTANEMAATAYQNYLGIDISRAALAKADRRSKENGRQHKNRFECADLIDYVPARKYDVILFRESMYHVPISKIKSTLDRYSAHLKDSGVFIIRLYASSQQDPTGKHKHRPAAMLSIMETEFHVVEKGQYAVPGRPTVLVFRPKGISLSASDKRNGASQY